MWSGNSFADPPPSPVGAQSYDELTARLRALRAWAGISHRELHRRVVRARRARRIAELPAYDTVHRCLQPGRRRLDVELVTEIAAALLGGGEAVAEWRRAHRAIEERAIEERAGQATAVAVTGRLRIWFGPPVPPGRAMRVRRIGAGVR